MSRRITDADLEVWEAYPSGSRRGFADDSVIVFHCLSDRSRRARYVEIGGDVADAQGAVSTRSEDDLLRLLAEAKPLP
jgi:hypothetical protein